MKINKYKRFANSRVIIKLLYLFIMLILSGCSRVRCCSSIILDDSEDSLHYLIIGIGIVTVPKPGTEAGVLATKLQAMGVSFSDQPGIKLGIGYSSSSVVIVPNSVEDVHVEISQRPGGALKIHTQKAALMDMSVESNLDAAIRNLCMNMAAGGFWLVSTFVHQTQLVLIFQS